MWVYISFSAAAMFEVHTNDVSEIDDNWQQEVENAEETLLDGNLHVSSSESETDGSDENENLALNLATWATKFGVSHSAVNELLCILRPFHGFLPKDARILLKTVEVYDIDSNVGSSYYHFGISDNVNTLISSFPEVVGNTSGISLQINFEGLRLFKSSNPQFWPILGRLVKPSLTSKKISNDQELIQSDPTSCPQNQKGNN